MTAASGLPSFTIALYATVSIFPGLGYVALWIQIRSQSAAPAHASLGKQIASVSLYLTAIPWPTTCCRLRPGFPGEGDKCKSPRWTGGEPKESSLPQADKR